MYNSKLKNRTNNIIPIVGLVIVFLSLYDMYYIGIGRLFDYAAFFLTICYALIHKKLPTKKISMRFFTVALIFLTYYILRGGDIKHFLGVLFVIGLTFLFSFLFCKIKRELWIACSVVSISIAAIFFVQLFSFRIFGIVIDFTAFFADIPSRIYIPEINYFRASSIYQEPNSYCVFAFIFSTLLLSIKNDNSKVGDFAIWILLATMIMSNSLWGISVSIITIIIGMLTKPDKINKKFVFFLLAFILISKTIWYEPKTFERFSNIFSDSSFSERYVGTKKSPSTDKKNDSSSKVDVSILGNGVFSNGFQESFGANGWSYLLYDYGILGVLVTIVGALILDRSKYKTNTAFVSILFTTFPYLTYGIFAFYIAMLFGSCNDSPHELSQDAI